jgi:hypothetical protein
VSALDDFTKSGRYLPKAFRDFHAQKDVFKTMWSRISFEDAPDDVKAMSWVTAHVLVIDYFLWFMAKRGWTLQRSRVRLPFLDLDEEVKARKEREAEAFRSMLGDRK